MNHLNFISMNGMQNHATDIQIISRCRLQMPILRMAIIDIIGSILPKTPTQNQRHIKALAKSRIARIRFLQESHATQRSTVIVIVSIISEIFADQWRITVSNYLGLDYARHFLANVGPVGGQGLRLRRFREE